MSQLSAFDHLSVLPPPVQVCVSMRAGVKTTSTDVPSVDGSALKVPPPRSLYVANCVASTFTSPATPQPLMSPLESVATCQR